MSLKKLAAGSGYEYLTRQVAAADSTELGRTRLADYYEAVARESGNAKAASNWVMTEVLRKTKDQEAGAAIPVAAAHLAHMIRLIDTGTISGKTAKDVFEKMWQSGDPPEVIVKREGLVQVSDEAAIRSAIAAVMARAADQVAAYRKGKTGTLGWFVGQVMKKTGGRADPAAVREALTRALGA